MAFDTNYHKTNRFTEVQFVGSGDTTNSVAPYFPANGDNVARVRCEGFHETVPIPSGQVYTNIITINLTPDLNTSYIKFKISFKFGLANDPDFISMYLYTSRRGTVLSPNTFEWLGDGPNSQTPSPLWTTNFNTILSINGAETELILKLPLINGYRGSVQGIYYLYETKYTP